MHSLDSSALVDQYSARIHRLETDRARAHWELATTGSEAAQERLVALDVAFAELFSDDDDFRQVNELYTGRHETADARLLRQIDLLYLSFISHRDDRDLAKSLAELAATVQSRYMNLRATVDGTAMSDNELREVLRSTHDSEEAQRAWEGSKQIGPEVAQDVVRLAEIRNEAARRQGYESHYHRSMAVQEINPTVLMSLLDSLEKQTREPFRQVKSNVDRVLASRFGIDVDDLRPWHYGEPFFQEPPVLESVDTDDLYAETRLEDLANRTFSGMGLHVEDILARSDLYEREHKDQHAFCTHIDRMSDDVRILCNLRPNQYWAETILHELGHAVYDKYLDAELPFLLHDIAHISTSEAIAMLAGRLTHDPRWLRHVLGAPDAKVEELAEGLRAEQRLSMLILVHWTLVVIHFERALYENPRRPDLNDLWWDLVERFQMVHRPDGRDEPDWAAKIHIALYPVYYQNYVLGELTASQLQSRLERETGGVAGNIDAGDWLRQRVFALGARYPWNETIRRATGEELDIGYFVRQFVV